MNKVSTNEMRIVEGGCKPYCRPCPGPKCAPKKRCYKPCRPCKPCCR